MAEKGIGELGNCFFPLASLDCLDRSQYVGEGRSGRRRYEPHSCQELFAIKRVLNKVISAVSSLF